MKLLLSLLLAGFVPSPGHPVSAAPAAPIAAPEGIEWFTGPHMSALGKARTERRMVALYFWMDGSAQCSRMWSETLQQPAVADALAPAVCLGVDIASAKGAQLIARYGITTLPTVMILSADGEREDALLGFIDGPNLLLEWARIQSGVGTVSDFRKQLAAAPEDLALQHALALKLRDIGDQAGHDKIVAAIRAQDPRGETLIGARLYFWEVRAALLLNTAPADVDLQPLYTHVAAIGPQPIRFEAWNWITGFEAQRARNKASREAARQAWDAIDPADMVTFGPQLARNFWLMQAELDAKDKEFVLEVMQQTAERARSMKTSDGSFDATNIEAETYEEFLAMVLDAHSMAEFLSGHRKRAITLIEEVLVLFPDGDEYPGRLALYRG